MATDRIHPLAAWAKQAKIHHKDVAEKALITGAYFSQIVNGDRRPGWDVAKRLAALTSTAEHPVSALTIMEYPLRTKEDRERSPRRRKKMAA